jgi:hypothetical protein
MQTKNLNNNNKKKRKKIYEKRKYDRHRGVVAVDLANKAQSSSLSSQSNRELNFFFSKDQHVISLSFLD